MAARYIKRKLWEKGVKHANIWVSIDTLRKISEKLSSSDSMGSDQILFKSFDKKDPTATENELTPKSDKTDISDHLQNS